MEVLNRVLVRKIEKYINEKYESNDIVSYFSPQPSFIGEELIDFTKSVKKTFSEILLIMIDERKLTDVEVYKKANIDRKHFSKMRNKNYHPRKSTVIKLIFAMQLDMDEAEELLKSAGYALSTGDLRDVIIMYFIENGEYDLTIINKALEYYEQEYI